MKGVLIQRFSTPTVPHRSRAHVLDPAWHPVQWSTGHRYVSAAASSPGRPRCGDSSTSESSHRTRSIAAAHEQFAARLIVGRVSYASQITKWPHSRMYVCLGLGRARRESARLVTRGPNAVTLRAM